MKLITRGVKLEIGSSQRERRCSRKRSGSIQASASSYQTSESNPISIPSNGTNKDPSKKPSEAALILIRHGESLWNEKNLFTGCVDVPLTKKGVEEAVEAGKRISNIPIDMIYTSSLIRAQMTAMLAMTQHRRKKVPIVMHDENEQAKAWSQIFSEETKKQSIPVVTAWQLNERMYGELQGLNKQETADKYGKEQVHEWRRSYDIPPPNGESLEMCAERAVAYFKEQIEPQLQAGKNVMIAAHGNSLRSIIMNLDKLTSQEVISLELSTGIPMLYIVKEGEYIRRGVLLPLLRLESMLILREESELKDLQERICSLERICGRHFFYRTLRAVTTDSKILCYKKAVLKIMFLGFIHVQCCISLITW